MDLRKTLNPETKKIYDQSIVDQIRKDQDYIDAKIVSIFIPMNHEIDLLDLIKDDKIFLIPRVDLNDMVFVKYEKDMEFVKSSFGVKEPNQDVSIYEGQIDYMVTPALAISKDLYRIGYGKGFYDRYIQKVRPKKVMGVIYPFQEIEKIEYDQYDQKLDGYIKG